ncbi:MAG: hypothetical protein JXM79_22780 [Sedimentisphaerales bacterium]|nr:hypothetical protein [Sedimentisphaerales bacterium]
MKKIIAFSSLVFIFLGNHANASIIGNKVLKINFTDANDAKAKATWSEPGKISITENGLGWDGRRNASLDTWIQTIPLAIGLSWRPAQSANITAQLKPEMKPVTLPNGKTYTPFIGSMFVRYSADGKHWSTWQAMAYPKPKGKTPIERKFTAYVNVPRIERTEYMSYWYKYQKMNVPWVSDEEAMVKWILRDDPHFFDKSIPFVGYVQFLYETSLPANQRITECHVTASYGLSGLHQPPKNREVYKERNDIPWRFKAK